MQIDLSEFLSPCSCGKTHPVVVRGIVIESGALRTLPGLLKQNGWTAPCIVCDENTFSAAGQTVCDLLPHAALACISPVGLHADEHGVEAVCAKLPERTDVLLAVGSGTIHDITRYLAHEKGIPFLSVPTAASVDGFVSTVAAMTWQGCKKTLPAVAPLYVIADSDVFSAAPHRLTVSGFADLLGKYTALADWKISAAVTGEYFCERVSDLVQRAVEDVRAAVDEVAAGGRSGCEKLMYGLLLSGLAMQMIGNSRPASGAEHHISHLWEMGVLAPAPDALHGEKVGIGLILCAAEYHAFADALRENRLYVVPRPDTLDEIHRFFPDEGMRELVLEENVPDPLDEIQAQNVFTRRGEVLSAIAEIPSAEELAALLRRAGGVTSAHEIGLDEAIVPITLQISPYVRRRLTLMRLQKVFERSGS